MVIPLGDRIRPSVHHTPKFQKAYMRSKSNEKFKETNYNLQKIPLTLRNDIAFQYHIKHNV